MNLPPYRPDGATQIATIDDVPIFWDGHCLSWRSGLNVDDDGDPACYGPGGLGNDFLANAGHPGQWWGVVTNAHGQPVVQGPNDPRPGYYISTTSYQRPGYAVDDPRRYIDGSKVPAVVIPGFLIRKVPGVVMGCRALVTNEETGKPCDAMVHDAGPDDKVGEGSPALAIALGFDGSPRHGGTEAKIVTVRLFPGVPVTLNGETLPLQPHGGK